MDEATTQTTPAEEAITTEQATALVGKHLLVVLEDVIHAHEAVVLNAAKSEIRKGNARLVIAAAQGFGRPLYHVVKVAARPRILRPERSIHVVRG
jgi:hypothetical protein